MITEEVFNELFPVENFPHIAFGGNKITEGEPGYEVDEICYLQKDALNLCVKESVAKTVLWDAGCIIDDTNHFISSDIVVPL